jgi:hypothetical protein
MQVNYSAGITAGNGVFDIGQFDFATFDSGISTSSPMLQVNAFNAVMEMGGFI